MIHIERCILATKDRRPWPQEQAHEGRTGGAGRVGLKGIRNGQKGRDSIEFAVASLPQMRRQDENTGPATHGAGRLSSVLPEVQIRLCDSFSFCQRTAPGPGDRRQAASGRGGRGQKTWLQIAFVDTFSFQAPAFYKKHDYREVFTLEEYPYTGQRHYYTKKLL